MKKPTITITRPLVPQLTDQLRAARTSPRHVVHHQPQRNCIGFGQPCCIPSAHIVNKDHHHSCYDWSNKIRPENAKKKQVKDQNNSETKSAGEMEFEKKLQMQTCYVPVFGCFGFFLSGRWHFWLHVYFNHCPAETYKKYQHMCKE